MARFRHEEDFESRPISSHRLEAYTDGVFAIAATLLVLDVSVDKLGRAIDSSAALWDALMGMQESLISFLVSFLALGMFWIIHIRQFEHVKKVDTPVMWLSILRLLGVVLIPFTTSINADFTGLALARVILPLNYLFIVTMSAWEWTYVTGSGRDLVEGLSPRQVLSSRLRAYAAVIFTVVIVIVSPFIGSWAFALFALNPVADRIIERRLPADSP